MKSRVFNVLQFWKNPQEVYLLGEDKATDYDFDEHKAEIRLSSKKTFTEWALITHDQDVYTEYDEDRSFERLIAKTKKEHPDMDPDEVERVAKSQKYTFAGNVKPKHTHIVVRTKTPLEVSQVAKWLGVPEACVDVPKGRGAFSDCLYYLCHEGEREQLAGKTVYPRDRVISNFDWQALLRQSKEMLSAYGQELNIRDFLRTKVRYEGYSVERLIAEFPDYKVDIMNDEQILKKARKEYIDHLPIPSYRINYYVEGAGGIGKNIACRALAHSMFPNLEDYECFFEVGGSNVSFEGYNGQPVIIWNDWRAGDFIKRLGGRGEVFDLLDSHPSSTKRHIKYGSVLLTNCVNLINSVQSYTEFLDGLAGSYTYEKDGQQIVMNAEDKNQAYRRFPIIIRLREDDFDVLLNKGIADGTYEYEQYLEYARVRGSFAKIAQRLTGAAKEQKLLDLTYPPSRAAEIVKAKHEQYISDKKQIPPEFENYGEVMEGQLSVDDMFVEGAQWYADRSGPFDDMTPIEREAAIQQAIQECLPFDDDPEDDSQNDDPPTEI